MKKYTTNKNGGFAPLMKNALFAFSILSMLFFVTSCSNSSMVWVKQKSALNVAQAPRVNTVKKAVKLETIASSASVANGVVSQDPTPKAQAVQPVKASFAASTMVAAQTSSKQVSAPRTNKFNTKLAKVAQKVMVAKGMHASGGGGKSQLIALILCIAVGSIGIHRFYLGYTWQGIVQLLTAGGCGVWQLIDLIRIINGDLQPKDGSYEKTL
jgi:hypothetical protein